MRGKSDSPRRNIFTRLAIPILMAGFLLIIVGVVVFVNGPTGSPTMITVYSKQFPIYDFTRAFLGLQVSSLGFALVLLTIYLGNPLVVILSSYSRHIRNAVSGFDEPGNQYSAKMFFVVLGALIFLCFITVGILILQLESIPYLFRPLYSDTIARIGLYLIAVVLITMLAYLLVVEFFGAVVSGLVLRVAGQRTPLQVDLDELATRLMFRELRSRESLLADIAALVLVVSACLMPQLQAPLLVAACSIWGFAVGKSVFTAFQRASATMGLRPRTAFKSVRIRDYLIFGLHLWMGILFVVVWRALLSWMLRPVSEYLSARAAINTVANVAHLGDLLAEMTQTTLYFMTKLISNYLIFIVFLFATIGLLYTTVFPEYFFRKSERIFRRKVILATVVFGVSLCSQIVISYLTPSSPSYLYSSLIFLVAVIITQFLQNAYEESTELQSR